MRGRRTMDDAGIRLRAYVDGEMTAEAWVHFTTPAEGRAASGQFYAAHVAAANAADRPWYIEIYEPAMPEGNRRTWFGTDPHPMPHPIPVAFTRTPPHTPN